MSSYFLLGWCFDREKEETTPPLLNSGGVGVGLRIQIK